MGIFSRLLGGPNPAHRAAKDSAAEQNRLLGQDYANARLTAANAEIERLRTKLGEEVGNGTTLALDLAEANKKNAALMAEVEVNASTIAELGAEVDEWKGAALRQRKSADYEKNRRVRPSRAKKVAG